MNRSLFVAIKAQLDSIEKHLNDDLAAAHAEREALREALRHIIALKPDNEGNSTRLAIRIARDALDSDTV